MTDSEVEQLTNASKSGAKNHVRVKCDTVLLSNRGYDIESLPELHQVRTHTIRSRMDKWEEKGLEGFSVIAGRGRRPEIEPDNRVSLV